MTKVGAGKVFKKLKLPRRAVKLKWGGRQGNFDGINGIGIQIYGMKG